MITLHFSNAFDGPVWTGEHQASGSVYLGNKRLLHWLEAQLGLNGLPSETDYLRIELYRQSLLQWQDKQPEGQKPFYAASLEADRLACAQVLLSWRDALLLSGWSFEAIDGAPERLSCLAEVEQIYRSKINAPELIWEVQGYADRVERVMQLLLQQDLPLAGIEIYEEEALWPVHWQRLFVFFKNKGIKITVHRATGNAQSSDLAHLQQHILGSTTEKKTAAGDGSLMLLKTRRDSDAAPFLAKILALNPGFKPLLLAPEMDRLLEEAMELEGLAPLGILSSSLARPSLQVLKLTPAFLWEPVDVHKIMEFVTLPLKPLDDGLSFIIARLLANKPGLFSADWFGAILDYLDKEGTAEPVRSAYEFWFNRRRYPSSGSAPKSEVIDLYRHLQQWAFSTYSEPEHRLSSLLVLAEQARRICEILEALPEPRIGFLELERIVRTIYEPSPVQFSEAAEGRLHCINQAGAFAAHVETLLWWDFSNHESLPGPDQWMPEERDWLKQQGVALLETRQLSLLSQKMLETPVWRTNKQLILINTWLSDGNPNTPHLLMGDIESAFESGKHLVYDLELEEDRCRLAAFFTLPALEAIARLNPVEPKPFLQVAEPTLIPEGEYETPTSLESLFYYPHRWFFRNKLRLAPVQLFELASDNTLFGNLSHRFFELMLKEDFKQWEKPQLTAWVLEKAKVLLPQEGASLLLYGREPERNQFLQRVQHAALSLISILRQNSWEVLDTEHLLEGEFAGIAIRGKADLVLARGDERAIVDLKWSGRNRRKEMIRNEEDLQLVLYGHLLCPQGPWPHSAYFILEEGRMLARNREAFKQAEEAGGDRAHQEVCDRMLAKMERTFSWRMDQIRQGQIELRSAATAAALDQHYGAGAMDLLEMRTPDGRWEPYQVFLDFSG